MKKYIILLLLSFITFYSNAQSETDKALSKAITKGLELAEKTGQFVIDQAPDLLKEFYDWNMYSDIFWIILWSILLLINIIIVMIIKRVIKKNSNYDYEDFIGTYVFLAILSVISVLGLIIMMYDLIYLLNAPKLYLIDHFIK